jgi:hypothetical protein
MVTPRVGSTGIIGSKGDLLAFDGADLLPLPAGTVGQLLSSDPTATTGLKWIAPTSAGVSKTMIFLGGASMGAGDTGKHFGAQDNANGSKNAVLSSTNQMASGIAGTINLFTWNAATGVATNIIRIKKNGAVAATFNLTGAKGAIVVSVAVALADLIAVEFNAGPALGNTTVQVWAS